MYINTLGSSHSIDSYAHSEYSLPLNNNYSPPNFQHHLILTHLQFPKYKTLEDITTSISPKHLLTTTSFNMSGLQELAMPTGDTDSYALCAFLACLCNALQSSPNIILYDMEVAYLNKQMLDNDVERQLRFFEHEFQLQQEAAIAQGSPLLPTAIDIFKTELKEIEANLSNCGLVTNAARFYKATKCNYFLVASAPNRCWIRSHVFKNLPIGPQLLYALQKHQERCADWHAYAICIINRKVSTLNIQDDILLIVQDVYL